MSYFLISTVYYYIFVADYIMNNSQDLQITPDGSQRSKKIRSLQNGSIEVVSLSKKSDKAQYMTVELGMG